MAIGYAFLSGAMEALIHDSLVTLKRDKDYAKIASRAQAIGLVGNAILISSVPLLYPIDERLPFVAGSLAYFTLFILATLLTEPPKHSVNHTNVIPFVSAVRQVVNRRSLLFFVFAGFGSAMIMATLDIQNLAFVSLGVEPSTIGILYAIGSLAGAVLGLFVHHLKRLSFHQFASVGVVIYILTYAGFGVFKSLPAVIITFTVSWAFWRYERILYQHYILQTHGQTKYKATLLSVTNNFQQVHEVWLTLLLTGIAQQVGVLNGMAYPIILLVLAWPLLMLGISRFTAHSKASV